MRFGFFVCNKVQFHLCLVVAFLLLQENTKCMRNCAWRQYCFNIYWPKSSLEIHSDVYMAHNLNKKQWCYAMCMLDFLHLMHPYHLPDYHSKSCQGCITNHLLHYLLLKKRLLRKLTITGSVTKDSLVLSSAVIDVSNILPVCSQYLPQCWFWPQCCHLQIRLGKETKTWHIICKNSRYLSKRKLSFE